MIDPDNKDLSVKRQCEIFSVPRSSYYYQPAQESEFNLLLMQEIDKQYMQAPFYGSRKMTAHLVKKGFEVNRKRVSRLMRLMGLEAMYPKPKSGSWQKKYNSFPYLLNTVDINVQNHVWGTDITYIPVNNGYVYLVAVIDLYSRFVLSWEMSNSLETDFCISALNKAFEYGKPLIMNSDQGVQFTSHGYIELLQSKNIQISMSGKGRCWDNIFVERFWRSLKYEEVYLNQYDDFEEALECIRNYINLFNTIRPHSSLDDCTPEEVFMGALPPNPREQTISAGCLL